MLPKLAEKDGSRAEIWDVMIFFSREAANSFSGGISSQRGLA